MAASIDHDAMTNYSSMHEDEEEDDPDDAISTIINDEDEINYHHHQQNLPHTLSRLSLCTSKSDHSMYDNYYDIGSVGGGGTHDDMRMYMSSLQMEGSDCDADDENRDKFFVDEVGKRGVSDFDNDDDIEPGCYSLPATPPRRRLSSSIRGGGCSGYYDILPPIDVAKEYASENEADNRKGGVVGTMISTKKRRNWRRKIVRDKWLERVWDKKKTLDDVEDHGLIIQPQSNINSNGIDTYGTTTGGDHNNIHQSNLVILTRPAGGNRSLCMDFEEVKACRDLGFELEHEKMMLDYNMNNNNNNNISSRISMNSGGGGSSCIMDTASTSTGGNSPIANWRISSPGDDPKDVKARLKVWAQAVALASASQTRLLG